MHGRQRQRRRQRCRRPPTWVGASTAPCPTTATAASSWVWGSRCDIGRAPRSVTSSCTCSSCRLATEAVLRMQPGYRTWDLRNCCRCTDSLQSRHVFRTPRWPAQLSSARLVRLPGSSAGTAARRQRRLLWPRPRARDPVPDLVPAVPPAAAARDPAAPRCCCQVRSAAHSPCREE